MTETTTIAPIDGQTAYDLLAAAVELTGPDHVTEYCRYTQGDNPCCVVGVALAAHGVPFDVLSKWDTEGVSGNGDGIGTISHAVGVYDWLADDAIRVFRRAQRVQDDGATWGNALSAARAELNDLNR